MIQNILKRTSLSQGADALVCCYSHRCVDSRLCEDSAAPAEQALVPVGVRRRRLRAGGHAPFLKKKKHPTTQPGLSISKLLTPKHKLCPNHRFIQQEIVGRLSHLQILRNQRISEKGSVCHLIYVSGRGTAFVICVSLSPACLTAISPWPEASPQDFVHTMGGGAWRGQGVTW